MSFLTRLKAIFAFIRYEHSGMTKQSTLNVESKDNRAIMVEHGSQAKEVLSLIAKAHADLNNLLCIVNGVPNVPDGDIYDGDPSAIFLGLPIKDSADFTAVEEPSGFTGYYFFTPEQRYIYLRMLATPYDAGFPPIYKILLIDGLSYAMRNSELHDGAFSVIRKIRNESNDNTVTYRANWAMLLQSLIDKNIGSIEDLYSTIKREDLYDMLLPDQFIHMLLLINKPFTVDDMLSYKRDFGFFETRCGSKAYKVALEKSIIDVFGECPIDISYIKGFASTVDTMPLPFICNERVSKDFEIPIYTIIPVFREKCVKALYGALNSVRKDSGETEKYYMHDGVELNEAEENFFEELIKCAGNYKNINSSLISITRATDGSTTFSYNKQNMICIIKLRGRIYWVKEAMKYMLSERIEFANPLDASVEAIKMSERMSKLLDIAKRYDLYSKDNWWNIPKEFYENE